MVQHVSGQVACEPVESAAAGCFGLCVRQRAWAPDSVAEAEVAVAHEAAEHAALPLAHAHRANGVVAAAGERSRFKCESLRYRVNKIWMKNITEFI